jgi:hypothetical protein
VEPDERAGWWTASDGRSYPPEARPATPPPPSDQAQEVPSSPPGWGAPPPPPPGPPPPPPGPPAWGGPGFGPAGYQQAPGPGAWGGGQFPAAGASGSPGLAIASLVLGIGSLLFALVPFVGFAAVPFAIAGVVLGVLGFSRARSTNQGKGLAIGGMATSAAALVVCALYLVLFVVIADNTSDDINSDPSNGICNSDRFLQDPDC